MALSGREKTPDRFAVIAPPCIPSSSINPIRNNLPFRWSWTSSDSCFISNAHDTYFGTDARPRSLFTTKHVLSARHPRPVVLQTCRRMVRLARRLIT